MLKTTKDERTKTDVEHVNGGAGYITREELITPEQRGEYCGMFNRVTLQPGCEIGHHEHHGEAEAYYIIEGSGMYEEDGQEIAVEAGDVTYCGDGHGHGLKNTGSEELAMIALILKK